MTTLVFGSAAAPGTIETLGGIGDTGIVLEPAFLISTAESALGALDAIGIRAFSDNTVTVHGTVHGDQWGILMGEEVAGGRVHVGDTGNVSGSQFAAIQNAMPGDGSPVGDLDVVNLGEIFAYGDGAHAILSSAGTVFDDLGFSRSHHTIANHGNISAMGEGGSAVYLENVGVRTEIVNGLDGVISALNGPAISIFGSFDVASDGTTDLPVGNAFFTNHGQVYGGGSQRGGDVAYQSVAYVDDTVVNTGLIGGAVLLEDADDEMTNSGQVDGDIDLGTGHDLYDGRGGSVLGTVSGGGGDDVFLIDGTLQAIDGGVGTDRVDAWSDVENVTGVEVITLHGHGDFAAAGDDGANEITGNHGDNSLNGNGGGDVLRGMQGHDEILGGAGRDVLYGDGGNDVLLGEGGDDSILGGAGDDTILGGVGQDSLRGQQGADVFLFESTAEIGAGVARDFIEDFQRGLDVVDVSEIGTGTEFVFNAMAGFVGGGTASIYYTLFAGSNVVARFDADGNGSEDARLQMNGLTFVDASDFVL